MSVLQWLALIGAGVLFVAYLRWDIARHPHVKCRRCGGTGRHYSLLQMRWGDCRRCGGTGRRRGLLPRVFGSGQ